MENSKAYLAGILVGFAAVAIAGFIAKVVFKKKIFSCEYDERQELIRGRAFKYGFLAMMVYFAVFGIGSGILDHELVPTRILCVIGIGIGLTVFAVYAIWHDAYYALKEKPTAYIVLFLAVIVLNVFAAVRFWVGHEPGVSPVSMNLIFAAVFLVILIVQLMKMAKDKKEEGM